MIVDSASLQNQNSNTTDDNNNTSNMESIPPMSRCNSGSSLSTVLSNFSVSSIVRLKPNISWNKNYHVFQRYYYSKKVSQTHKSNKKKKTEKDLPLLLLQLKIMSGIILTSIGMFLLAMMNLGTIIFLFLTSATFVLLGYTIIRYVRLAYQENPRFFFNFLPQSIQTHLLTQTSIHDYMIQGKNELEEGGPSIYKYMLIYFIPGLSDNDLKRLTLKSSRYSRANEVCVNNERLKTEGDINMFMTNSKRITLIKCHRHFKIIWGGIFYISIISPPPPPRKI